jgi:16S rRNA (cytosine967-C5)-methyltransferase
MSDARIGTGTSARAIAAHVLTRVFDDRAFAAASLDVALGRAEGLDPRDAGLATELVYGVLRTEAFLEAALAEHARTGRLPDHAAARAHLLAGAYTLAFLDRVPAYAAVSEAVDGVAREIGEKPARFANAILRAYAASLDGRRPVLEDAIADGAAGWLRGSLRRSIGRAGARAFLAAGPVPPPLGLAVADRAAREALRDTLAAAAPEGATIAAGRISPHALVASRVGDPRRLPGFEETWIVQEEGAQAVALALGARPGESVLDACAGRGNKSWLLARRVGRGGHVASADKHPSKLETASSRALEASGATSSTYATDWTIGPGDVPDGFDAVLVDAPCSGVGTLRRRPEIGRHRSPDDVAALALDQRAIARAAAARTRDGGRLVYAVCSVLREECEDVVAALAADDGGPVRLEPAPFDAPELAALLGDRTALRLLPHEHGTDGYFLASFVVRRPRG